MARKPKGAALGRGLSRPAQVAPAHGRASVSSPKDSISSALARIAKSSAALTPRASSPRRAIESGLQRAASSQPGQRLLSSTVRALANANTARANQVSASTRASPSAARPVSPRRSSPRNLATPSRVTSSAEPSAGRDARKYPRAGLAVRARLSLSDDPRRSFEAALPTTNISVGGLFLESTFFLKLDTKLDIELTLPGLERVVRARGQVVRIETSNEEGRSGFALRFTEYLDGSRVVLATHFLAPVLREFIREYADAHDMEADEPYLVHTADVLAAWELRRADLGGDVWDFHPTSKSEKSPKRR